MSNNSLYILDKNYENDSDEELIEKIRLGNLEAQNYLLEKYRKLVTVKANRFFLIGAENDDMIQEGMIGLFKAIQSFDLEKNNSFKTFANLCIERQLITAIKTSNRQKHQPLNSYLECLIDRYKDIVSMKASKFFMVGSEKEDILQEGYIGLYKAVKSFDGQKQNSFKTFAGICIERQLITAIKTSNRQKHIPLNSSFSLNLSAFDDNDETTILDILDTKLAEDPLDTITKREYMEFVETKIDKNLSTFEKQVLEKYIQGESYVDIAQKLNSQVKSVDNAIQRIRKKAIKCFSNED